MNALITFAHEDETAGLFQEYPVLYTGIGKLEAIKSLKKEIHKNRPDIVINLGIARSLNSPLGSVINIIEFIQRDMDARPLGVPRYVTPCSDEEVGLKSGLSFKAYQQARCGSADNINADEDTEYPYDVMDTESYALARVCVSDEIPFACLKYTADIFHIEAIMKRPDLLLTAATALRKALDDVMNTLKHQDIIAMNNHA